MERTERAIDAVIFDLGGVLMRNGRPDDIAGRFPDLDPDLVRTVFMGPRGEDTDHPWHRLERGEITFVEFRAQTRIAMAELGPTQAPRPAATASGSETRATGDFAFLLNDEMVALVLELREIGVRTAMLTNNVREIRPAWWPLADWPSLFDDIVDSHEVGIRKPNPAIYRLSLERLQATAERTAFLDDIVWNVEAANGIGMVGIHVEGAGDEAIRRVRGLVGW